jgi:hypothetical protein
MFDFTKVYRLGTANTYGGRWYSVYVKVEYKDGKLSITGVEGPYPSGNCAGGCGQINMSLKPDELKPAPGWTTDMIKRLLAIWDEWHLNDMKAGCEHQRAEGWGKGKLTLYSYQLTGEALSRKTLIEAQGRRQLAEGKTVSYTPEEQAIVNLPFSYKSPDPEVPEHYQAKGKSEEWEGHVRPEQHPEGKLCKPCPVCGYNYGTKWLKVEVPEDVLLELLAFPDTDRQPAWV